MAKQRSIDTLTIDGGWLCFNFINTVYAWRGKNLQEYLPDYATFFKWCSKVNLLPAEELNKLELLIIKEPDAADEAINTIKEARQILYNFFSAMAAGDEENLKIYLPQFNALISRALSNIRFTIENNNFELMYADKPDLLEPLWVILKSAYDATANFDHKRIKECPACGWMFLDQTKNGKKVWCSPLSCGSIDKTKRYYLKKKNPPGNQ
jgi:predicted RNA-binding Zn ribbon-like protein